MASDPARQAENSAKGVKLSLKVIAKQKNGEGGRKPRFQMFE